MFDVYFWSVILFFTILGILIYRNKKNLEFHGIVIMKKWKSGRNLIKKVADISPRFWNALSLIFVVASFGIMVLGTYLILVSSGMVLGRIITRPAIQIILPIPQSQPINGTGFIGVPFWFWILVVPFVMFPHELAHGIMARVNGVKIKSVGLIQVLIFSGAFVEPSERDINKSSYLSRLKIFSAGSMANITISIFLLLLSRYLLWPLMIPSGVLIYDVIDGSGAQMAGIEPGIVIEKIDGVEISVDYNDFTASYSYLMSSGNLTNENIDSLSTMLTISEVLGNYEPGDTIQLSSSEGMYDLTLSGRPENSTIPYMGIMGKGIRSDDFTIEFLFPLTWWLTTMSYFVAIFNLLPIHPLDGGLMIETVTEKFFEGKHKKITKIITMIIISLLIFNFVGPYIMTLF